MLWIDWIDQGREAEKNIERNKKGRGAVRERSRRIYRHREENIEVKKFKLVKLWEWFRIFQKNKMKNAPL